MDHEYKQRIRAFYEYHRRMPSYSEIMEITGLASSASVFKLVDRLKRQGFLFKDDRGKLIPGSLVGELRVLGLVEAGFPSPAEEETLDTMSLDEYLVPHKESTFLLKVKGDSMKDAGIVEGDMVIVERTCNAKPGQIVIAEIDGGWTMKYLRMKGGKPYLEPANPKYPLIHPKEDLTIAAVVTAVVRKYP